MLLWPRWALWTAAPGPAGYVSALQDSVLIVVRSLTWEGWLQKAGSLTFLKLLEQKEFMGLIQGVLSVVRSWI